MIPQVAMAQVQEEVLEENTLTIPPQNNSVLQLKYFYGNEIQNLIFYMTPKLLMRNKELSALPSDVKLLYILLLDRMKLSAKNGYKDNDDRLFVFFTQEEAEYELHKSNKTVCTIFAKLEEVGLIERVKLGQGKADKIYVKNIDSQPADYPTFREYKKQLGENLGHSHANYTPTLEHNLTYTIPNQGIPTKPMVEPLPYTPIYPTRNLNDSGEKHQSYPRNCPQNTEYSPYPTESSVDNYSNMTRLPVDNYSTEQNVHSLNGNNDTPRSEELTFQDMKNVQCNNTDVTNNKKNKTDLLKPTLPPNPTASYPHDFRKNEEFLKNWGEEWSDMTRDTKLYVLSNEIERAFQKRQEQGTSFGDELEYLFYNYRTDTETMGLVLDYIMNMDELERIAKSNSDCSKEQFTHKVTKLYKQAILEMLTTERQTKTKHGNIGYSKVMEKVFEHLTFNDYSLSVRLDSIVDCTVSEYKDAAAQTDIRHKLNYMKSCVWSTFLTGNIYEEQQCHKYAAEIRSMYG
ncbi:MAG: replication initiator protein A [Eubacteriales bacterium]